MEKIMPLITFRPFHPNFMPIYHKRTQNIPDIWRVSDLEVPLHRRKQKSRKEYESKYGYWNSVDGGWCMEAGQPMGYH